MLGLCGFKSLQFSVVDIQVAVLCLILRTILQLLVSSWPYHTSLERGFHLLISKGPCFSSCCE